MKSAQVTLTIVASIGLAARAQPRTDPCSPFNFNEKGCQAAVEQGGYCSGGGWVAGAYHEQYPYYYDTYRNYVSAGGTVTPARIERCRRSGGGGHGFAAFIGRGGFGATGHGGHE